jgi:hypothetical protein
VINEGGLEEEKTPGENPIGVPSSQMYLENESLNPDSVLRSP